jgi:hypothetical protein
MRDIRLYYYQAGTLRKWNSGVYYFGSIEDCKKMIEKLKQPTKYRKALDYQWVITEYFNPYDSKIIEVI